MSTLSAFPYIGEQSFATPGAINSPLSIISANIAAVNAAAGSVSGVTITPPSGNTITIASDLSVLGTVAAGPARLGVSSNVTNYLFLSDTSAARSNYVIGSQVGGTADGLNIWDDSGQTMIVSFSKQSIRFYQNVVGPVFDVGGALASTLNAGTFGTGADSKETRIQAAILAAANQSIARVYIPANMYPYSASSISYIYTVQLVREGGDWGVYDLKAYGASGISGGASATSAFQAAFATVAAAGGGTVFVPNGIYMVHDLWMPSFSALVGGGPGAAILRRVPDSISTTGLSVYDNIINAGPRYQVAYSGANVGQYITIENIEVDGNNLAQSGWGVGKTPSVAGDSVGGAAIDIRYVDQLTVRHVWAHHAITDGIRSFMCPNAFISRTRSSHHGIQGIYSFRGNGINIDAVDNSSSNSTLRTGATLLGCETDHNADEGVSTYFVTDVVLDDCWSHDNGNASLATDSSSVYGFEITGSMATIAYPQRLLVRGCRASGNVRAGAISNAGLLCNVVGPWHSIIVNDFTVADQTGGGVEIEASGAECAQLVLSNIQVDRYGTAGQVTHGVFVNASNSSATLNNIVLANVQVSNATARTTGSDIIVNAGTTGNTGDVSILGCSSRSAGNRGIALFGPVAGFTITGCTVSGSSAEGILVYSNGAGNTIGDGVIVGNSVSAVSLAGIALGVASFSAGVIQRVQISDNVVKGSGTGIYLTSICSDIRLGPNLLTGNTVKSVDSGTRTLYQSFTTDGSATHPLAAVFESEASLGLYRSASSTIAQSYGTFTVPTVHATSVVRTGDGTALAPGFTFVSDASTGLFKNGSSAMDVDVGGTFSARFVASSLRVTGGNQQLVPFAFTSEGSLGLYRSGVSTIAPSYGTFNLATNAVRLSMRTAASLDSTTLAVDEVAFSIQPGSSGASLAIRSGGTIFYFASSNSTKAP